MADTSQGGQARLNSWGASITGTAASSGTVDAGSVGALSINDGGSGTNTLGATVTTTQNGTGGTLAVTIGGTTTFSGECDGERSVQKAGAGTLILSNSTGTITAAGPR